MKRHSNTARTLAGETAADVLRSMLRRVITPIDALREIEDEPSRHFAGLIKRLSQEIDETVLPRTFVLCSDAGIEATIIVSNRRLVELKIGEQKVELDADQNSDAAVTAREYAKAIRALALRSGPMRLKLAGSAPANMAQGVTCTATHMSKYGLQVGLENRLKTFLKMSHAQSLGWIFQGSDDQIVTHGSDNELIQRLQAVREVVVSKAEDRKHASRIKAVYPSCSAFSITQDTQVLIAIDGTDRLFAAFPNDRILEAVSAWRQIFKTSEH